MPTTCNNLETPGLNTSRGKQIRKPHKTNSKNSSDNNKDKADYKKHI